MQSGLGYSPPGVENPEARQRCAAEKAPGEPAPQGWVFTRLLFALWDTAMRWPFTSMGLYWESHITDKDRARSCKIFKDAVIILSFVKKKKLVERYPEKRKELRFDFCRSTRSIEGGQGALGGGAQRNKAAGAHAQAGLPTDSTRDVMLQICAHRGWEKMLPSGSIRKWKRSQCIV